MGAAQSGIQEVEGRAVGVRGVGVTNKANFAKGGQRQLPSYATPIKEEDTQTILESLGKVMIFQNLDEKIQMKIVKEMYERPVKAGEILIREGDTGTLRA